MKVLEKHRAVEAENASLRLETQSRARETENARRRMLRETTLQGKLRIQAEMEHGALQAQFEHVHRDNVALRDELDLKTQELLSVQDTLAKSGKNAREMHIVASQTCQARYRKHLSLLDGMLQGKWGALSPQQGTEIELDFSAYGLGDEDMRGMISVLASWNSYWLRGCEDESASSAWTFRINLAENYFTDESIDAFAHLVALLNHRGCLDIRHNMFTHRGIRSLANALKSQSGASAEAFYVHKSGLIECFEGVADSKTGRISLKVDMRDNPRSTIGEEQALVKPHTSGRQKRISVTRGGRAKAKVAPRETDAMLVAAYSRGTTAGGNRLMKRPATTANIKSGLNPKRTLPKLS